MYKSVLCCPQRAQVLPVLAEPQPCSCGEQNHFLRWIWQAGRAQQASLSHWLCLASLSAQCWFSARLSFVLPAQPPSAYHKQMKEGVLHLGGRPADPEQLMFSHLVTGLTALQTHMWRGPWEPLWTASGAAHRGCQGVPGSATTQGVSRKECCSRTGLGIAAGAVEHGKPEYLPEMGARETACWKWPRQLCMTLGKPSVALAGRRKQAGKFKHFPCSVGLQLNFPQVLLQVHGQRRHKVAQIFCLLYASMRQPAHLLSLNSVKLTSCFLSGCVLYGKPQSPRCILCPCGQLAQSVHVHSSHQPL